MAEVGIGRDLGFRGIDDVRRGFGGREGGSTVEIWWVWSDLELRWFGGRK